MDVAKVNMGNSIQDRIILDFKEAKQKFELYERFYIGLSVNAKQYLKQRSIEYKNILLDIQEIILPTVKKKCPLCKIQCCKLYTPEPSIYIARSVGGFECVDYLLVRCDTILPEPYYEHAEKNLCTFWKDGCILPADCRSYLCIQYFCDELKNEVDMQLISKYLEKAESILTNFSLREILT
jgi:hypothetical protein